jgi:zinc and cadmium transporter
VVERQWLSLILAHIVAASLIGGLFSLLAAAWLSMGLLSGIVNRLVSLSAGLLLGTAVLHLIPEAIESKANIHTMSWVLLAGIVGFFLLEKFAIVRHNHHHEGDGHEHHDGHDHEEAGPGGLLILVGDSIHNFSDGILIAAAFLADVRLGWLTTFAIAAHEIPQEIGDFIVLLNALLFNALASLASVLGGVIGYFALQATENLLPYVLMLAVASFVYIALADLVPDMHKQSAKGGHGWRDSNTIQQLALMGLGVLIVALLTGMMHHH